MITSGAAHLAPAAPAQTRGAARLPWHFVAIVLVQAGIALAFGLPGHLSADSIIQLYEGRTLQQVSFNPPLMSMLLGAFDRLGSAPVGFVLLSQAMLGASTWLVLETSQRRTGWLVALAGACLLNPLLLIYAGIVWKDVLLAHAAVLLYLLIARAWRQGGRPGPIWMALVISLTTIVLGARQQGLLFALPAAAWAAAVLTRSRTRPRGSAASSAHARETGMARLAPRFVVAMLVFLLLPLGAYRLIGTVPQQSGPYSFDSASVGWRVLVHYDLVGILAHRGTLAPGLPVATEHALRGQIANYSPYRVDAIETGIRYWVVPNAVAARVWRDSILHNPQAYLQHRFGYFGALLGLRDMRLCAPAHTGVGGPVVIHAHPGDLVTELGLRSGPYPMSRPIQWLVSILVETPLYMHAAYAIVMAALAVLLAKRREFVLATLAVCSLGLLGSYLLIGIACDFRYAYTLTVATSLLAAQWLLARPRRSQAS